jgi:EAL domain-containing protein (putative c-di-GMP-specific phosphodiesterase class I)
MHALRKMGIKLAIDDFGTGYSSLSYLKNFPVDKLKIDQSFVHDLSTDANEAAIIRAILIMAKSLKLTVIAEGVETIDQLAFLRSQGCDEYQGNYLTAPVLPGELARFLHAM